jgi:hypothetical protein
MYLNGTKCATLALSCILSLSAIAKNTVPKVGQGADKPLCFIENNGQFTAPEGSPISDLQYKLTAPGMNMFVGNGKLVYQFRKLEEGTNGMPKMQTYTMDVTLMGADPSAKVVASEKQAYFENYYISSGANQGITAQSYNRITYQNVYPGIDWVIYTKDGNVEYDFVVRPGADASQIQLKYGGATALAISKNGGIIAESPMGKINEKKPYAYNTITGKEVAANFKLKGNVVSFETEKCNSTFTIDPFVLWSTYFGGANEDVATCVKVSGGGNTYIGGYTTSTTVGFIGVSPGPINTSYLGGYDAFITKYDVAGVRAYTTYVGGAGNDRGNCLAIDGSGTSIYLGGQTSSFGVATGGAYDNTLTGPSDGFIFKINNNGVRQWATYYGGAANVPLGLTGNDEVNGIIVDGANNVYITGRTEGTGLATGGAYQNAISGSADAFIAKFNAGGGINFSTYYGGTGVDEGSGVTYDGANNVIITGATNSIIGMVTLGAFDEVFGGVKDAFVAKFSSTGATRMWGTYFGGPGSEQGTEVVCNTTNGSVAVIGYTTSTTEIATAGAHQTTYGGGAQDAFVAYFNGAGALNWSTYFGGPDLDYGESICLDPARNIVIAGGTFSTTGISSAVAIQPALAGNYDAFVAKFTTLGQRIWGTYYGGALYDYAFGVACDGNGQVIFAGHTTSTAGISTAGASQTGNAGGTYDAFVTKLSQDMYALIAQPFTDTLICAGGPITIPYTVSFPFTGGNVFTAELSNASGSFAAPAFIGSVTATGGGIISGTVPLTATPGSGYRIRIVASAPVYISPDQYVNITVVPGLPAATITANTPVCVGTTLNLLATATWSMTSYTWAGPAGTPIASVANPSVPLVTLADEGVYTLTTTHNGCPDNVATIAVDVNDVTPAAPIAYASALNCDGGTISLFADTAVGSITGSYSWSGPLGFTSTMQYATVSPITAANAGNYTVVDTIDGCPSTPAVVTVSVTPTTPVSIAIAVSPNDTVCGGTLVNFTATTVNGGVSPHYQWMNGSMPIVGAMSDNWASATLTNGAAISCVLNSNVTCPSPASATSNTITMRVITSELLVHIFAAPGLSVTPGDSINFSSVVYNAGVGPTFQWQRNGTDIAGATSSTYTRHNITTYDTITLVVTSTMACVSPAIAVSNALVAHPNTSVNSLNTLPENIELFPNPNSGNFTVKADFNETDINAVSIKVLNPLGQMIFTENTELVNKQLNHQMHIDQLPAGIYLLQINAGERSKTLRFTIR